MNIRTRNFFDLARAVICLTLLALTVSGCSDADGQSNGDNGGSSQPGALYINTNQVGGNDIVAFARAADGSLSALQTISTGGSGTAGPTESQDSVVLNADHTLLFTVNVASNDISAFSVDPDTFQLTFVQRIGSGGDRPVEVAVRNNLLYVANSGEKSGVSGFSIGDGGTLTPIDGSIQPLSFGDNSPFGDVTLPCTNIFPAFEQGVICNAAQPADIKFSPDGKFLIVAERLVNQFSVFAIDENGIAGNRQSRTSSGESPFGIAFDPKGHMLVAESFLDSPGTGKAGNGAASSYNLTDEGDTRIITGSLKSGQRTGCWMAITPSGRYAYMTNPGAGNITGYEIADDGSLSLINDQGSLADSNDPRDEDITPDGRYLYVLNNSAGSVNGYTINEDGTLDQTTTTGATLPVFGQGLAAF